MYKLRNMLPEDFDGVMRLSHTIYPDAQPWNEKQLTSQLQIFPEGQFVVEDDATGTVVAYAATLIVYWDDYAVDANWRDFTDNGYFTNHDPESGRTLYAADVMVDPDHQGRGIGKLIYQAREKLLYDRALLRIRAGARLQGFHRYHDTMTVEQYVQKIVDGDLSDPTLTFQLKRGFKVLGVVHGYMRNDPKSLGYAAVIEFLNEAVATPEDRRHLHESPYYK
ncbi:MAG TPA: GNAT family N-acetyltransferase [Candidatus Krumholzibacteria bacterium]|nr:GNAT family N-acetyltransferase [Candidatus Krumholzibacteria bacterium]